MTLAERNAQRAEATRTAALSQGLSRFPPEGRGPSAPDRYESLDGPTVLEMIRALGAQDAYGARRQKEPRS